LGKLNAVENNRDEVAGDVFPVDLVVRGGPGTEDPMTRALGVWALMGGSLFGDFA